MSEVLEMVDPSTLIVAENVRKDTKLTKGFLASIKSRGVMIPIVVDRTEAGLEVIDGQRRTLAAVEVGLADVPVFVTAPLQGDKERIVDQLVMNDQRESITEAESVAAVKQLELFGMPLSSIVKKTGYTKKAVETALAVAGSEVASKVLSESSVSLLDAAVFVEFEDDERAVEALSSAVSRGDGITHLAERLRQDRREEALKVAFLAEQQAAGYNVLAAVPDYDDKEWHRIGNVYADAKQTKGLKVEDALAAAPDDVYVAPLRRGYGEHLSWGPLWLVRNLAEHGWSTYANSGGEKTAMTDEEKDARRVARETTKAWFAASVVRVAWIHELLQRKTMPAGWEILVAADAIRNHGRTPTQWRMILSMVGKAGESDTDYGASIAVASHLHGNPTKAAQIALAIALGSIEGEREFDKKGWQQAQTAAKHLQTLSGWGYELAEVELGIVTAAAA